MTVHDDEWHPCARGDRCVGARSAWEGGRAVRVPALTPRVLCDRDRGLLLWVLAQLPELYKLMDRQYAEPQRAASAPRVSGTPERNIPIRVDIDALQREVVHLLGELANLVRERLDKPSLMMFQPPALTHARARLGVMPMTCSFLRNRVDTLMVVDPDGKLIDRVFDLQHRMRDILGLNGARVRMPGVCPTCDARGTMVRWDSDPALLEGITCTNCEQTHLANDYVRSVHDQAGRLEDPRS